MRIGTKITRVLRGRVIRTKCRQGQYRQAVSGHSRHAADPDGYFFVAPMDYLGLLPTPLLPENKGVDWIYGWPALNSPEVRALLVANALSRGS